MRLSGSLSKFVASAPCPGEDWWAGDVGVGSDTGYMVSTTLTDNDERVAARMAAGHPLDIGVTLSYVGGGSDKFWTAVLLGQQIAVNYGPHFATGAFRAHHLPNQQKAAQHLFRLLREKTGKGYAVSDAALFALPAGVPAGAHTTTLSEFQARQAVDEWSRLSRARAKNPRRMDRVPNSRRTSRTAVEGAAVLLALMTAEPDAEAFMQAACVDESERFLPPIASSHPRCPSEARFMAAFSPASGGVFG